jgi:hypothetical protein
MNKRLIAFIPILSLFLSLPLIPANAALKEGDACSKAGITSVDSGRNYKCTKVEIVEGAGKSAKVVGTRLVWMLNDVDMSGRCNPPVSGLAAPTPVKKKAAPTPVKKKAAPTPVKKKAAPFQSIAPIKSADYPLIGTLAKNTILNQKGSVHDPFVKYWDPTTTELKRKFYSQQIEIMKKYFSPMIPNNSKAHIYILGSDKEWACEVFKKAPDVLMFSTMYQVSSKCEPTPGGGLILDAEKPADYTDYRGAGVGLSVLGNAVGMVATSNCDTKYLARDLLIHETFHAIQWIYTSHKLDSKIVTEALKIPSNKGTSPMWMVEGSAQYMGYLLSADGIWTSAGEDKTGFILANNGLWKKSYEEFAADYLHEAYSIGAVMYEYMLAKYGLERTLSYWPEAINSLKPNDIGNFLERDAASKVAFQTVFGLSLEGFFSEVKPYIEWSLEQANRVYAGTQG